MVTLLSILLVAAAFTIVGLPLLRPKPLRKALAPTPDPRMAELLSQKEALYASIRELDFDFSIGNLSETDYRELKQRYEEKAVYLLKSIDDLEKELEADLSSEETAIEREVLRLRRSRAGADIQEAVCPKCGAASALSANFCWKCGTPLGLSCPQCQAKCSPNDRFCYQCGAPLPHA